jgi:hypothetical protein
MKLIRTHKLIAAGAAVAVLGAGGAVSIASASGGSTPGSTATGTLTVTVTRPNGTTHTRPARQVRCAVTNGAYVLYIGGRHGRGHVKLTVSSYNGAGSYTGSLTVRVHALFTSLSKTISVPVTITSSGGSATKSWTLSGKRHPSLRGKTVSATASWTCMP